MVIVVALKNSLKKQPKDNIDDSGYQQDMVEILIGADDVSRLFFACQQLYVFGILWMIGFMASPPQKRRDSTAESWLYPMLFFESWGGERSA